MADEIIIKYKADVSGLTADLKTVQTDLKATETVGTESAKKTTASFNKTAESTKSLRTKLKELKAQLANATDPKDIEKLARAAGKLTDQIEDATDAAKVFASESKFEQIGNAFGSVVSKLRNLDFSGAVAQSKLLVATSKSLTFKEALGGVKDLGATLLNVGKSLLLNPIFLIGAAVTGIIANFDKLKNSGGIVGKVFTTIGEILGGVVDGMTDFANVIGLVDTETGKFYDNLIEKSNKVAKNQADTIDRLIKLRQAEGKSTFDFEILKQQQISNTAKLEFELLAKKAKAEKDDSDETKKRLQELNDINANALYEIDIIRAKANAERLKKEAELNKKLAEEAEKLRKVLRDLQTQNLTDDYERERKLLQNKFDDEIELYKKQNKIKLELERKLSFDIAELNTKYGKVKVDEDGKIQNQLLQSQETTQGEIIDLTAQNNKVLADIKEKERATELTEEEKKRLKLLATISSYLSAASTLVNGFSQVLNDRSNAQIQQNEDAKNENLAILQEEYDNKLISQEIYESRKKKIEEEANAVERELKKEQFERNKQLALINATIATAQAISGALAQTAELGYGAIILAGLMAVLGAAQIGAIASQPTPKFEKGGRIGGKRHSQGGTLIEAEVDEFVVNRKDAIKHYDLVDAINSGNAEDYINKQYIAPILKEQQKKFREQKENSFADSIVNSMMLNSGQFKDGNLLEALKRNRQSDRENTMILVKELSKRTHNSRSW